MNLPNLLSLSRVPFLFLIVIFLQLPPQTGGATVAFLLFLVAALTDLLDGWVARRFQEVSDLGKFLDALTDKILTLGLFVALLAMKILPAWTLLLVLFILTREFLITGLRMVAASRGVVLAAERSGKWKTAFQMLSLALLLLSQLLLYDFPDRLSGEAWNLLHSYGGVGCFVVASALTIFSGVIYLTRYGQLLIETPRGSDTLE